MVAVAAAGRATAQAAADWPTTSRTLFSEGRYFPVYEFLRRARTPDEASAQFAAAIGDEATALARASPALNTPPDLTHAETEDAVAAIVRASRGRRVVVLNEAHGASRHRAFLAKLVRALRAEGFSHLAAETFTNLAPAGPVEQLHASDQLTFVHGTYIADPVFAEAVRDALQTGYRLVAYEQTSQQAAPRDVPMEARVAAREQAQADNLAAALERAPGARFLVHVGYDHLRKSGDRKWFAYRLAQKTGIEPLTIEQYGTGSFGPHARDNIYTQTVLARFQPRAPIVVRTAGGHLTRPGSDADLGVFHPTLPDVDGRPGWLAADPERRRVRFPLPAGPADGVMLAQAIHAADADPAIPADQFLARPGQRELVFFLRPGLYRIRLETAAGFTPLGEARA